MVSVGEDGVVEVVEFVRGWQLYNEVCISMKIKLKVNYIMIQLMNICRSQSLMIST